ncbi:MAG: DoxX family membrane protein [bacterium]|nr:DoxX family membrane protein [bacterium]
MSLAPTKVSKICLALLRIAVGWFLLYQGITAVLDPEWSIKPMIHNADTLAEFYDPIEDSDYLPYVSYVFKGLYILVGGLILLGLYVRPAALVGIVMMLFLYFPLLTFPYVNRDYFIVDQHLLLAITLLYLYAERAGEVFGLGTRFKLSRH